MLLTYYFNFDKLKFMYTVSARQLQREYKKVLKKANKVNEPVVVISNNKLQGAVIGISQLEKLRLNAVAEEALKEYKAGKTKSISTKEELEAEFAEIRRIALKK